MYSYGRISLVSPQLTKENYGKLQQRLDLNRYHQHFLYGVRCRNCYQYLIGVYINMEYNIWLIILSVWFLASIIGAYYQGKKDGRKEK